MKHVLMSVALAMFGLAPAIGAACEYVSDAQASLQSPAQLGSEPAPVLAATKAPASAVAKAVAPNAKNPPDKAKAKQPEQKLAASTVN